MNLAWLVPIFLFAVSFSSQAETAGVMEVLSIKGNATARGPENVTSARRLKVGSRLRRGTEIKSGTNGWVDIGFKGAAAVRVAGDTTLWIDQFACDGATFELQLSLTKGRIVALAAEAVPSSKFEVKTHVGVAGVRGASGFEINESGIVRCNWGKLVEVFVVNGVMVPPLLIESGKGGYFDQWRLETRTMGAEELRPLATELESLRKELEAKRWEALAPAPSPRKHFPIRASKAHPTAP
jgi:hypothetical protein